MTDAVPRRPGGRIASRPLHFIWLVDGSGSMAVRGKVQALNQSLRSAVPHLRSAARENPHASVFVNAVHFADEARWIGEKLTPASEFTWQDIGASGASALGEALTMVGDVLQPPLMTDRALPPVIVLITDGLATDDFHAGLTYFLSKPWARQALRVVVGIGEDSSSNEVQEMFRAFMGDAGRKPFHATNPAVLAEQVRLISTVMLKAVSSPPTPSQNADPQAMGVGWASLLPIFGDSDLVAPGEADVW